jgi:hypothetical protein
LRFGCENLLKNKINKMKKSQNKKVHLFLLPGISVFLIAVSFLIAGKILANRGVVLNQNANDRASEVIDKRGGRLESNSGRQKEGEKPEELKPEFKFDLKEEVIEGDLEIKGEVDSAQKVEFYLIKEGSVSPEIYLGKAKGDEEEWEAEFNSLDIPNGKYELYAKIKNVYGVYDSDPEKIEIKNIEEANNEERSSSQENLNERDRGDRSSSSTGQEIASENRSANEHRSLPSQAGQDQESQSQSSDNSRNDADETVEENDKEVKEKAERGLNRAEEASREIEKKVDQGIPNFAQEVEKMFSKDSKNLTREEKNERNRIKEQLKKDIDGDGLPDHEEIRLGTNPRSADTDGDGYLDGDEVGNGFDPLSPSSGNKEDKMVFEDPREKGEESQLYKVEKVDVESEKESDQEEGKIKIEGKALPNSFVTLYIYSDPLVVTVKTDKDGNWSYVLDKELEDGEHEVYAAVTDNTGKVTYKSKPFAFVKTARAITSPAQAANDSGQQEAVKSPIEKGQEKLVAFVLLVSFSALILALISIVLLFKQNKQGSKE